MNEVSGDWHQLGEFNSLTEINLQSDRFEDNTHKKAQGDHIFRIIL